MEQRFLPLPPLTGKRYVLAKSLVIIPVSSLIGMPDGDGIPSMRLGYMGTGFMSCPC